MLVQYGDPATRLSGFTDRDVSYARRNNATAKLMKEYAYSLLPCITTHSECLSTISIYLSSTRYIAQSCVTCANYMKVERDLSLQAGLVRALPRSGISCLGGSSTSQKAERLFTHRLLEIHLLEMHDEADSGLFYTKQQALMRPVRV